MKILAKGESRTRDSLMLSSLRCPYWSIPARKCVLAKRMRPMRQCSRERACILNVSVLKVWGAILWDE